MTNATTTPLSPTGTQTQSVLASLRSLIPARDCDPAEAMVIAEAQATRLHELLRRTDGSVLTGGIEQAHIAGLPRIRIAYDRLPVSGTSHWNGHEWVICLNASDRAERQRFTLLHEFKHIIDHGAAPRLYRDIHRNGRTVSAATQAERAADYFAGCALVPRTALKRAWGNGLQHVDALAEHFSVSRQAMEVRLDQTGLSREVDPEPTERARARCARPVTTPPWQRQQFRAVIPTIAYRRRSFA